MRIRPARREDVPVLARLLADDTLGAGRESANDPAPYEHARRCRRRAATTIGMGVQTDVRQGAEQAASTASNLTVGQVDVGKDVSAAVGKVTTALQSVADPATARNAIPQIDEATTQLNRMKDLKAQLPAAGKQALAESDVARDQLRESCVNCACPSKDFRARFAANPR